MSDIVMELRDAAALPTGLYARAADEIERNRAAIADLVDVGRAVIARWESPLWKDTSHTGEYIHRLREACNKHEIRTTKETT